MKQLILLLVTVSLNVFGQLMMKRGMSSVGAISGDLNLLVESLTKAIMNPYVLAGVASYGFSTIFWLVLLSRVELSYAYPALSMGYVLITLVSALLLGEQVSAMRWAGVFVIVAGVILVTRG
ncbi:MAG: EamA family transporter [Caldilineaceae bacterium]|jgi:drug/metabolite transporter (DMT)-like permease|nr:EamA family transporter [Caldilineaceae bacterium]